MARMGSGILYKVRKPGSIPRTGRGNDFTRAISVHRGSLPRPSPWLPIIRAAAVFCNLLQLTLYRRDRTLGGFRKPKATASSLTAHPPSLHLHHPQMCRIPPPKRHHPRRRECPEYSSAHAAFSHLIQSSRTEHQWRCEARPNLLLYIISAQSVTKHQACGSSSH